MINHCIDETNNQKATELPSPDPISTSIAGMLSRPQIFGKVTCHMKYSEYTRNTISTPIAIAPRITPDKKCRFHLQIEVFIFSKLNSVYRSMRSSKKGIIPVGKKVI